MIATETGREASAEFHFLSEYQTFRVRPRSFGFSLLFHAAVVAVLIWLGSAAAALPPERPIYDSIIQPQEKTIVWRHLTAPLPNLDSSTRPPKQGPSSGKLRANQVVIADAKKGSEKEFVWQPTPIKLPDPVKAPNLIALQPPSVAAPPPPPRAKPREFVPPPITPKAQAAQIPVPVAPSAATAPQLTASLPSIADPGQVKIYRTFVAPPAQKSGSGSTPNANPLPDAPDAPNAAQNATASIAAINLDGILGEAPALPPGRRPGNFSAAPNVGDPAAEKGGRGTVPGLTTRGRSARPKRAECKSGRRGRISSEARDSLPGNPVSRRGFVAVGAAAAGGAAHSGGDRPAVSRSSGLYHDRARRRGCRNTRAIGLCGSARPNQSAGRCRYERRCRKNRSWPPCPRIAGARRPISGCS